MHFACLDHASHLSVEPHHMRNTMRNKVNLGRFGMFTPRLHVINILGGDSAILSGARVSPERQLPLHNTTQDRHYAYSGS